MSNITLASHRFVLGRLIELFRQALQTPDWGRIKCWYRVMLALSLLPFKEFCWSQCAKQCVKC